MLGSCSIICFLVLVEVAVAGPNLQSSRITKEYRATLETALRAFSFWLAARSLPKVGELVQVPQRLKELLVQYLQHMFDNGAALSAGRHTVIPPDVPSFAQGAFARRLGFHPILGATTPW